ncbi:helix-turn-helix domain-containing protein [Nostoc sp. MG11]|uniref:helix-turn-helix domain-containing protein n=1 Tax=Nostoc sp. MG11 TaxID=2721166 RepID=UPI00186673E9|nr:helix-turn-helix domain-containing protein [Nostoc sp. MG11]
MTLLNETQLEQLKEISRQLRQVRQEKALKIEEIAAQILIRPALLLALEEERFEELPELVFVQGFIRRYGDALGLDGNALTHTLVTKVFRQESHYPSKKIDKKPVIYIPLFVIYILLLLAATTGLFYTINPRFISESLAQKQKSPSEFGSPSNAPASLTLR